MPTSAILLNPGVNTDKTPSLNEAGISQSNNIRFREGLVEKRGGYTLYSGGATAIPTPRALCAYLDSNNAVTLGVGFLNDLAIIKGGVLKDISPVIVNTTTGGGGGGGAGNGMSTTNGSSVVTITDLSHSPNVGDVVNFYCPVEAGGITLYGAYVIASVVSATQFTISVGTNANATVSVAFTLTTFTTNTTTAYVAGVLPYNGYVSGQIINISPAVTVGGITLSGNYTIQSVGSPSGGTFQITAATIPTSVATVTQNAGLFPVSYNAGTPAGTTPTYSTTTTKVPTTDWTLANYGHLLIACAATSGQIYSYDNIGNLANAQILANAPLAGGILVSDAQQQIIAYGGPPGTTADPNYVAWSDTGNPNTWLAAVGNQAGSYRIPTGSGIVGASLASQDILLWTDIDLWLMSYINYPLVYGFSKIATGCGLLARNAWAKVGSSIIWMSQKEFWIYDSNGVRPLDCPVYDSVFPVLSQANSWKIRASGNSGFNEAVWNFPSASGSGENDTYVCYNFAEGTWDYGSINRNAFIDQSVAGQPIGADSSGNIFQHETSPDANGSALSWRFRTGYSFINEGEDLAFVDWMRPDFKFPTGVGTISVTLYVTDYVADTPSVFGPYSFTTATEYIDLRCRGRYVALEFSGSDIGSFWRIGRVQMRFSPDGRR